MQGFWLILFPSIIPVTCVLYFIWCAIRLNRDSESAPPDSSENDPHRWRRTPRRPRGPRRGPHGGGAVAHRREAIHSRR